MESISLKYVDSGGTTYTQTFTVLAVKGFDAADDVELFPGIQHRYLSGSFDNQNIGFFRKFEIRFAADIIQTGRKFLLDWTRNNLRYLTFTHDFITESDLQVVLEDPTLFAEWLFETYLLRSIVLRCKERTLRTSYPTVSNPTTIVTMYRKKRVKVTGTKAAPETFTTNSGLLATDEDGVPFPAFTSLVKVSVDVNGSPYQEKKVFLANTPSLSGTNITFQLAADDAGEVAADGFVYVDIRIYVNP